MLELQDIKCNSHDNHKKKSIKHTKKKMRMKSKRFTTKNKKLKTKESNNERTKKGYKAYRKQIVKSNYFKSKWFKLF